ncbi:helix-turn-helix domain-containing protein [Micromonospora olivasterospora]|uniref:Helix-turn-helix protein n=1 Tax=Micromonospora olivasterospora TaxID=1880 RepID=A0A562IC92_MICOL|nr:helix-turn-helix domain-containing protein [Micromonospora olivasterospora]TWH68607.1 helix-turn-helix protein [Micromonospora olivasterospora]
MSDEIAEALEARTPAHFKALAHPFRQRLLYALGAGPATISQLAAGLGAAKGTVAHHLKVLTEAGMVRVAHTRQVRGGTEQYHERTYRRLVGGAHDPATTTALLRAVGEELAGDDDPLLHVRHLRLTPAQARRLRSTLEDLVAAAEEAGPDEPRYGVLVGLYRQAAMPPAPPVRAAAEDRRPLPAGRRTATADRSRRPSPENLAARPAPH